MKSILIHLKPFSEKSVPFKVTDVFSFIQAACMAALLSACNGSQPSGQSGSNLSGSISIDGSSTVYPITEAIAEEYRKEQPGVKVTVGLSGTGGGFKKFSRGDTDINNASRPIKPVEDSICKVNNVSYLELMVAYDGLAIVVNPQNDWVKQITVAELKTIWEPAAQGKIKRWKQIRPEWPDEELHLYGAGVESGTYDYFTEAIVGKTDESRGDYTASEDDNVLVQGIASDRNALGFFGFAYYEENKDKLKLIPVDDGNDANGAGAILPSIETVKNKTYAPLSRPLFIYVTGNAAKRPEVQNFVEFYLANAALLVQQVGYIALNDSEYQAELDKFKKFAEQMQ
ncbi:MAG TPA: PstS family phosphate ABC transporter substrate-binding protein [Chitinophagales bacterium]|nr:PstS family phosphate ABC transporter substrate-binding protein [Chitinophagales bacterium]